MEVKSITRTAFLREWRSLRGPELSDSDIRQIAEAFDLPEVRRVILAEARRMTAAEEKRADRRHRMALRALASQYARYLYRTSECGEELNVKNILKAKRMLRTAAKCPVYPCR